MKFLSTSPARGTTFHCVTSISYYADFYPRPPRGGRPSALMPPIRAAYFYPRPPRGGRPGRAPSWAVTSTFLSTSPARGTTVSLCHLVAQCLISIHVPREGDDGWMSSRSPPNANFYPRPPRGGRQMAFSAIRRPLWISIHVPREGDDFCWRDTPHDGRISIHVPREGDDVQTPVGAPMLRISIHVPREGDDGQWFQVGRLIGISIHVPREGDDRSR